MKQQPLHTMRLARIITYITLILCSLYAHGQAPLRFDSAEWDFGTIREADGPVSHTFVGRNTSDRPIVILRVVSSCGCTVPEYSQKPILPGETARIRVTFDPANRPGIFSKNLTVFDSQRQKIAELRLRGSVIGREKSLEELYPLEAGPLRLTQNLCTFAYLVHGRHAEATVGIANPTGRTVQLQLVPTRRSGLLRVEAPATLHPGERAEIRLRYELPDPCDRYGTVEDLLTLRIDGRDAPIQLMTHGIAVDNPDRPNENFTPKAEIDKYIIKFGVLKHDTAPQQQPFRLTNTGDGPLVIRAVECDGGVGCTLRAGQTIDPGASLTAYATLDPARQEYGFVSGRITVVTNDPAHPMRRLRITAVVAE